MRWIVKAKRRKWGVTEQAKYVEQKAEELPRSPAKMPRDYCKRLKGEHVYELAEVRTYKHYSYPQGYTGPRYLAGWADWKEYRCTGCGKKRMEREETKLDSPVVAEKAEKIA